MIGNFCVESFTVTPWGNMRSCGSGNSLVNFFRKGRLTVRVTLPVVFITSEHYAFLGIAQMASSNPKIFVPSMPGFASKHPALTRPNRGCAIRLRWSRANHPAGVCSTSLKKALFPRWPRIFLRRGGSFLGEDGLGFVSMFGPWKRKTPRAFHIFLSNVFSFLDTVFPKMFSQGQIRCFFL
jgi:hypothetical protein